MQDPADAHAPSVALLGAGRMGSALVAKWVAAGRPVVVWNRTPEAARALEGESVRAVGSVAEAVTDAPVVATMLTNGAALTSVLLDQGGLSGMRPGATLVDLSTVDIASSQRIAAAAQERGVRYLRGAVSGTPPVVRSGSASLLLSGPADALEAAKPVLDDITPAHSVVGDAEEARVVKIAVNSMLGGTMQLLAEATLMAEAAGVDRSVFLDALDSTVMSSRFVSYKGTAIRTRDYAPTFTTSDMKKDMTLVADLAKAHGVALPVGSAVLAQLRAAVDAGYGADDFLSLLCIEQAASGRAVDLERGQ